MPWQTQGAHIPLLFYVKAIQGKIKGKIWTAKPKFLLEETFMSSEEETAISFQYQVWNQDFFTGSINSTF